MSYVICYEENIIKVVVEDEGVRLVSFLVCSIASSKEYNSALRIFE